MIIMELRNLYSIRLLHETRETYNQKNMRAT